MCATRFALYPKPYVGARHLIMKVTRIAYSHHLTASKLTRLRVIARRLGVLRTRVWHEYGSMKGVGLKHRDIRKDWLQEGRAPKDVPARLWKETLRDTFSAILAYREAAKVLVRRAINKRMKGKPAEDRKEMYKALKSDTWKDDSFLRRQMRRHYRHGATKVNNQIVLDTGCYKAFTHEGRAWIEVMSLVPRKRLAIPLRTRREPSGALRLIIKDNRVEVHYAVDATEACSTRPCGTQALGVDKGYTEVFVDSDGTAHGEGLGKLLSAESDALKVKYQRRSRLRAIAEAKPHKRTSIEANNLGRAKLEARSRKHQSHVKDKIYKATHAVIDKAGEVVAEGLTKTFKSRGRRSKDMKRRLSGWVKGLIAVVLQQVSQRRGASLKLVSASYTSQMDHRYGILLGERKGDRFHCFDGVVFQSDENAAQNILARARDKEICLWTPYRQVKSILQIRTELWLSTKGQRLGLLNLDSSCRPP